MKICKYKTCKRVIRGQLPGITQEPIVNLNYSSQRARLSEGFFIGLGSSSQYCLHCGEIMIPH